MKSYDRKITSIAWICEVSCLPDKQCLLANPSVCRKLWHQRHPTDNCTPCLYKLLFANKLQKKDYE